MRTRHSGAPTLVRGGISIALGWLIALSAVAPALAAEQSADSKSTHIPPPQVTETVLPNGLKVVVYEDHSFPVASCLAWYRVGSKNEVPGTTGISHLLEHLLFGTVGPFRRGDIAATIARHGGQFNGYTSDDFTAFFETLPSSRLELALRIESQRMRSATFTDAEVKQEIANIQAEFESEAKDPAATLSREVRASLFQQHPYHNPTMGWRTDVDSLTVQQLKAHYDRYFCPDNCTLIISGDVTAKQAIALSQQYFSTIAKGAAQILAPRIVEPPQRGERRITVKHAGRQELLQLAYHAPALDDPDAPALVVLERLLNMPISGRLKTKLVDSRICNSASASFESKKDPGLFSISCTAIPGTAGAQQKINEAVDGLINQLKAQLISDGELKKARAQAEFAFFTESDSPYRAGFHLGYFDSLSKWQDAFSWPERLRAVSASDIQRVTKRYLNSDARVVAWLAGAAAPKPSAPKNDQPSAPTKSPPSRQLEHTRLTGYKDSDDALAPARERSARVLIAQLAVERDVAYPPLAESNVLVERKFPKRASSQESRLGEKQPAAASGSTVTKSENNSKSKATSSDSKTSNLKAASNDSKEEPKGTSQFKAPIAPAIDKNAEMKASSIASDKHSKPAEPQPSISAIAQNTSQKQGSSTPKTDGSGSASISAKVIDQAIKDIPNALPTAVKDIPSAIGGAPGAIKDLPNAVQAVPSVIKSLPTAVGSIPTAVKQLPSAVGSIPSAIKEIPGAIGGLPGAAVNAVKGIPGAIGGLPGTAASTLKGLPSAIGGIPGAAASAVLGMPAAIGNVAAEIGGLPGALGKQLSPTRLDLQARVARKVLKNGVTLVVYESHLSPIIHIEGAVKAGAAYEPTGKEGLAALTASLLNQGTTKRGRSTVLAQQEEMGLPTSNMLHFSNEQETIDFQTRCMTRDAQAQLDLIAETLVNPLCSDGDLEKAKSDVISELRNSEDGQDLKVNRALIRSLLASNSPFSPEDPSQVAHVLPGISVADVKKHLTSYVAPGATTIIMTGDIDIDQASQIAERSFESWTTKGVHQRLNAHPNPKRISRTSIPTREKSKATVCFGQLVPVAKNTPEYGSLLIADAVFSSHPFISRLNKKVSADPILAQAIPDENIETKIKPLSNALAWSFTVTVDPSAVSSTIQTFQHELKELAHVGVSPEEFAEARRYLLGYIPVHHMSSYRQTAKSLLGACIHSDGTDSNYFAILHTLRTANLESVNRTIKTSLKPDQTTLVVMAPPQSIRSVRNQIAGSTSHAPSNNDGDGKSPNTARDVIDTNQDFPTLRH